MTADRAQTAAPSPSTRGTPVGRAVEALTFDVWDTLIIDDSDEPRRAALGLPSKAAARVAAFTAEVRAHHPHLSEAAAAQAWERSLADFQHQWKVLSRTPGLDHRLAVAFAALGVEATPGTPALIERLATMEVEHPPDPAPGVHRMLEALSGRYRLGIISDAIVTPGTGIRAILQGLDLLRFFEVFVFSDEAGASKPAPAVFEQAAAAFGLPTSQVAHVGDRESNDVLGPKGVGGRAVLYTGIIDRGSASTQADLVCSHHDRLPELLSTLSPSSLSATPPSPSTLA